LASTTRNFAIALTILRIDRVSSAEPAEDIGSVTAQETVIAGVADQGVVEAGSLQDLIASQSYRRVRNE
jgi:hypothetical protein